MDLIRSTGVGVEVQHPRFAADTRDAVDQGAVRGEQQLAVTGNVDHAVVGRDEGAHVGGQGLR